MNAPQPPPKNNVILRGQSLSPGLAAGPAFVYRDVLERQLTRYHIEPHQVEDELNRIRQAVDLVCRELEASAERIDADLSRRLGDVFRAHGILLRDAALMAEFQRELTEQLVNAEAAVQTVMSRWERQFRSLDNDVLRERADDLFDLERRLLQALLGEDAGALEHCPNGSVLIVRRLAPSEIVHFRQRAILAVAMARGASASHAALLTREMGLPGVTQLPSLLDDVSPGDWVLVDGFTGTLVIRPDEATQAEFEARLHQWRTSSLTARQHCHEPAVTRDGILVEVMANVAGPADVAAAVEYGADGIGLYRIGHVYRATRVLPTEEQLFAALRSTLEPVRGKQITVRFLDTGGDKPLPYVDVPREPNPFLGRRGVRFLLAYPELMRTQCRALLRLAQEYHVRLLVPMVTLAEDLKRVREHLEAAADDIGAGNVPPLGAMIETPAAALCVGEIAPHADFLAIGTNDLTQYTMAAGRENPLVSDYFLDDHAAILRLIRLICEEAAGKPLSVCGELAGKASALQPLLSLGIRTLSVAPPLVPGLKDGVRKAAAR